jgi:hypothetical protein
MSEETWQVLDSEEVLRHPFLRVSMERVLQPDGRVIQDWPIVDARDYVMVVAQNEVGEVLVLEGYKHGAGRASWQVVGGYLETGEEPSWRHGASCWKRVGFAATSGCRSAPLS